MRSESATAPTFWLRVAACTAVFIALVAAGAAAATDETVVIGQTLVPTLVEIEPGGTVTWSNEDAERHRVRSKDGPEEFDSGNLETGETFTFSFTAPGSYAYYDHRDRDDEAYFGTVIVSVAGTGSGDPLPETGAVSIIDRAFQPNTFAIATGGSIEWSNDDGEAHTVTSTSDAFDSGILGGGATFEQVFAEPGAHTYFCFIHPEMRGTIMVRDPVDGPLAPDGASDGNSSADTSVDPDAEPSGEVLTTSPPAADSDADTASVASVSIIDRTFQPDVVEMAAGDPVKWSNDDSEGHTVTAIDGSFNSGVMTIGDEFSMTFEAPGTYDYFCAIHPEMTGSVVIAPPDTS